MYEKEPAVSFHPKSEYFTGRRFHFEIGFPPLACFCRCLVIIPPIRSTKMVL